MAEGALDHRVFNFFDRTNCFESPRKRLRLRISGRSKFKCELLTHLLLGINKVNGVLQPV